MRRRGERAAAGARSDRAHRRSHRYASRFSITRRIPGIPPTGMREDMDYLRPILWGEASSIPSSPHSISRLKRIRPRPFGIVSCCTRGMREWMN